MLAARGELPELVYAAPKPPADTNGHFVFAPRSLEDIDRLCRELKESGRLPRRGVIHLWNLDAPAPEALTAAALESAIDLGCLSRRQSGAGLGRSRQRASSALGCDPRNSIGGDRSRI